MVQRTMIIAVVAGVIAGLAVSAVQMAWSVPLILEAERYEEGAANHASAGGAAAGQVDSAGREAPSSGDGHHREIEIDLRRTFLTVLTNILIAFAYGLLLAGVSALRRFDGPSQGLLWGAVGFVVFAVAPSIGLPPELPGTAAADLTDRQAWWFGTSVCTGSGLALLAWGRRLPLRALGGVLIALPHVFGAPRPEVHGALAPPELQSEFIVASLVTNAVLWLVLGGVCGYLSRRLIGRAEDAPGTPRPAARAGGP